MLIYILNQEGKDISISIFNILGEKVYGEILHVSLGVEKRTIDISGLAKGLYFIQIKAEEVVINRKLITQ